jgi:dihydrofolate synthase/folylpolyglutamate synthase
VSDDELASLLGEVLDVAGDVAPSFFEVTTAAAFLAFSRHPADASVIEVGLGGRLDATNVIERPSVCGIVQLGIDHQAFLGDTIEEIAAEKAGIAKHGVPLVTLHYPASLANRIGAVTRAVGAPWHVKGGAWDAAAYLERLHYRDEAGKLELPLPRLAGTHQAMNAALAVAMLRHQTAIPIPEAAIRAGLGWADWPARLQRLAPGPLRDLLPEDAELWIDGGHNPNAARAIADFVRSHVAAPREFHLVIGLLANKDAPGVLKPFAGLAVSVQCVPVPDHPCHPPETLAAIARDLGLSARPAASPQAALERIAATVDPAHPPMVLIGGSLYLCGELLAFNHTPPD